MKVYKIDLRKFIGMLCCGLNTAHRHASNLLENNDDFYIYLVTPFLKGYLQQIFELVKHPESIGNPQNIGLFSIKPPTKKKSDCFEKLWSKLYAEICQTNSVEAWMEAPRTALDFTGTYRQAHQKLAVIMDEIYQELINEGILPPPIKPKKKLIRDIKPEKQEIDLSSSELSKSINESSINPSQEDFPPFETRKQFWIDKQKEKQQFISKAPTEEELIKQQKRRQIALDRFKEMQVRHKLEEEKRTNTLNRSKVALKHFKRIENK